jgi:hypothetical protein
MVCTYEKEGALFVCTERPLQSLHSLPLACLFKLSNKLPTNRILVDVRSQMGSGVRRQDRVWGSLGRNLGWQVGSDVVADKGCACSGGCVEIWGEEAGSSVVVVRDLQVPMTELEGGRSNEKLIIGSGSW